MGTRAQWDILTGIGFTALGVAAGRAAETHRADGLVADPYAEAFVRAAAPPVPLPTTRGTGGDMSAWPSLVDYVGVRTRFFDEFFASASEDGLNQVVLLAAGLDARAFRLEWPRATTVYELDVPRVLEFKAQVLAGQGARPACERRAVPCDLREDWPSALQQAGFDAARPTAWLAEGLLAYLPDDAKERLFSSVTELSASGSRIALDHPDGDPAEVEGHPAFQEMGERLGVDIADLWPAEQDYDIPRGLAGHGWVSSTDRVDVTAQRYRRPLDDMILAPMRSGLLITAVRQGDDNRLRS